MDLDDQLLSGNRRALARVISRVEDGAPDVPDLLAGLYPHTGRAHIVGSDRRAGHGQVDPGQRPGPLPIGHAGVTVGIIAVDPTSPFSGGALAGRPGAHA